MQVEELLRLTNWVQENIHETGIPGMYQELHKVMNQNLRRANNQALQSFETEKDELISTLKEVNTDSLTLEQINFLDKEGLLNLIGESGANEIESILYLNNLDLATATEKVKELSDIIDSKVSHVNNLQDALSESFVITEYPEVPDNYILIRVYFQQEVNIKDLKDFKQLSAKWYDIGRGIALALNDSPEDIKVISAQKGSIIVDLAAKLGIAKVISSILKSGLEIVEKYLSVRIKMEELKALQLNNAKIELELKKEIDNIKKNGLEHILNSSIDTLKINREGEGDKVAALKKSISTLIDFTEKGGEVDIIEPEVVEDENEEGSGDKKEILELRQNVKEIRKLENKIKLLESGNNDK